MVSTLFLPAVSLLCALATIVFATMPLPARDGRIMLGLGFIAGAVLYKLGLQPNALVIGGLILGASATYFLTRRSGYTAAFAAGLLAFCWSEILIRQGLEAWIALLAAVLLATAMASVARRFDAILTQRAYAGAVSMLVILALVLTTTIQFAG